MIQNYLSKMKEAFSFGLFFLLLFVFLFTHCAGYMKNNHRQAVLIILDAARPDHFSCNGYIKPTTPEMDKLAAKGAFFTNCYSQGLVTRTSLPCFLYSRYFMQPIFPNHHSIPFESPNNLFRRVDNNAISIPKALEKEGFLTAAIVAHEWLTEKTKFGREFNELYNLHDIIKYDKKYAYPRAEQVIDFTIKWMDLNKEKDFFLYIHIMDTHFPHIFEEDAKFFFGKEEYSNNLFAPSGLPKDPNAEFSEHDIKYLNSMYDGSLRYTDRQVGRLIDFLEKTQMLDDILVMITADHGEFLLERKGMVSHGGEWYDPVAKIPLIIHFPKKVKPQVNSNISEMIDIGPTILDLLGIKVPIEKQMDGKNLLAEEVKAEEKTEVPNQQTAFIAMGGAGLRNEKFKCLFNWPPVRILRDSSPQTIGDDRAAGLKAEIYDLTEDPEEKNPLILDNDKRGDAVFKSMFELYREKLTPLYKRYETARTDKQPELSFAVSSAHFTSELKIPYYRGVDHINAVKAEARKEERKTGWLRRSAWDNSWLYADSSAGKVKISFSVPDGEYFLSFDINGCCEIEINGEKKVLCSPEFVEDLRWKTNEVDFGPVEVREKTLNVLINPIFEIGEEDKGGGEWVAVRLIGFEPIIDGNIRIMKEKEKKQEMLERLRTLGYIK
jgi:choline-sulfatase